MFYGGGQVEVFVNGGVFINGLFDSLIFFKFVQGGGFVFGVMGEVGFEVVMFLMCGFDGLLGVQMYGGGVGGVVVVFGLMSGQFEFIVCVEEGDMFWFMVEVIVKDQVMNIVV